MEKLLSQEEIDALLKGVESGEVDTTPQSIDTSGVKPYDFNNPDRIVREKMPTLEVINEQFSKLLRNDLSYALRKSADVFSKGIQMKKFGDFIKTLPVPSSLNVFKMEPLKGYAILAIEAKLVFTLLDLFFGGKGKGLFRIEGRDFTAIENRLIKKVVDMIFSNMDKAWAVIQPFKFCHVRSEINPQFVTITHPMDLAIIITFNIEVEESAGTFAFCILYSMIEPIKTKLYSNFRSDQLQTDNSWPKKLLNRLEQTEIEITVELGKGKIRVRDLFGWKVGDIFYLDNEISDPLTIYAGDVPKYLGRAGVCGANKAVQIEEMIKIQ